MMPVRPASWLQVWFLGLSVGIFGTAHGLMFLIVVKQSFL